MLVPQDVICPLGADADFASNGFPAPAGLLQELVDKLTAGVRLVQSQCFGSTPNLCAPAGYRRRLGGTFVVAQALVVALLAELEYTGLRRSAPLAA